MKYLTVYQMTCRVYAVWHACTDCARLHTGAGCILVGIRLAAE